MVPTNAAPVTVFVVEDDEEVRRDLARVVEARPELALAAAFDAAEPALEAVLAGLAADVALVDLGLPRMQGQDLIRRLKAARPSLEIIVVTVFEDDDNLYGAVRAGASGYLLKDTTEADLVRAVLDAHRGGAPMTPSIARRILVDLREPAPDPGVSLSAREVEVLQLLTKGASYPEIGKMLAITLSTVQSHIRAIYRKLEVCTKAEATAEAYRRRMIR